ncbi:hypothetical protein TKK_0008982 [Trichogramma kaykai]
MQIRVSEVFFSVSLIFFHVVCSDAFFGLWKTAKTPVILVPGLLGSRLEANIRKSTESSNCPRYSKGYFTLWMNVWKMASIDCWIDNMRLIYDRATKTNRSPPGVDIRVPGWGDPGVLEYLDEWHFVPYFKPLVSFLENDLGYVRNVSLRAAPYDFRRGPSEQGVFFSKFQELIEETYHKNGRKSVVLITHSMGCLLTLIFLQWQSQEWKNKYIKSFVPLNGPWAGTVKSLAVFAGCNRIDERFAISTDFLKPHLIIASSLAFLLPSPWLWNPSNVLVTTSKWNYTVNHMGHFLTDIGLSIAWEFYKNSEPFKYDFRPPGVEVHCLYGEQLDTVERYKRWHYINYNEIA